MAKLEAWSREARQEADWEKSICRATQGYQTYQAKREQRRSDGIRDPEIVRHDFLLSHS